MKNKLAFSAAAALFVVGALAGCNSSEPASEPSSNAVSINPGQPGTEVKAPPTGGKELKVGDVAPDFALKDQNNALHKLSESEGKYVVLAFYPADMTGGCTLEAHKLTDALPEFQKRKTQVFGISVQGVESKKEFCDKEGIKYPLLADDTKSAAGAYGVLGEGGMANRVTFIIGPDGKIAAVDPAVEPISAATKALSLLDAVQKKS